jgi:hypothetical protein
MDIYHHHRIQLKTKKIFFIKGTQQLFIPPRKISFFLFCFRNPMLNKSFDVLPQIKDDNTHSDDHVSNEIPNLSDKNIIL